MNIIPAVHPDEATLVSYGLGKTDDTTSEIVAQHLEICTPCRSRVANMPPDSFVNRLQAAKSPDSTAIPEKSLSSLGRIIQPCPTAKRLPPELAACEQYEEIRELGKGGMGVVYLAKNKLMGRDEVLKVVNKAMLDRPGAAERFLREIQSAARLQHPNVVAAYSALQLGDLLVFAMEYVPGQDLAQVVKSSDRPLPVVNACYYTHQTALGLQHAFEKGMVHRDIKPSNLILTKDGKKQIVKILDFGLAKVGSERGFDAGLTGEGKMLGTPDFMAPEQALDAAKAGIRADIYSLGCTLYYLLMGRAPFTANSLLELLQHHQSTEALAVNLIRPDVPVELASVIARMMAKDPHKRYQTPEEVAKVLAPFVKVAGAPKPGSEASRGTGETAVLKVTVPLPAVVPPTPPVVKPEVVPAITPKPVITASANESLWESLSETSEKGLPTTIPARTLVQQPKKQWPWLWFAAPLGVVLIVLLGFLSGGVFKVKTSEGTIVLENLPPDAEVLVDGEKVTVSRNGERATVSVNRKGPHKLNIKQGSQEIYSSDVTVTIDGEPVRVRVENATTPKPAPAKVSPVNPKPPVTPKPPTDPNPAAVETPGKEFQLISGEKNWDKWHRLRFGHRGDWNFGPEEFLLDYKPKHIADNPVWATRRDDFQDFQLRFEVKIVGPGAFFCFRDHPPIHTGNLAYPVTKAKGYAILLGYALKKEELAQLAPGSLLSLGGSPVPFGLIERLAIARQDHWKKAEWNAIEVTAQGSSISILVNGQSVVTFVDLEARFRRGKFSFTPTGGCNLMVQKIQIKELATMKIDPIKSASLLPPEKTFVPLFNGTDMTGWKVHSQAPDSWKVEAGLLTANGPKSFLYSERSDYRNFHLRVEARINQGGNSGVFFRSTFQKEDPDGYQVELMRTDKNPAGIGSLLIGIGSLPGISDPIVKVQGGRIHEDEGWILLEIISNDNHITTKVNGKTVVDHELLNSIRDRGHLVLEHLGPGTVVDFRKIEIKVLP